MTMMRVIVGMTCLGCAVVVNAQQEVAYQSLQSAEYRVSVLQTVNVMHTPVTIELKDVPLGSALEQVSKRSGVALFYSPVVVPVGRKVSLSVSEMTLELVLQRLLQGTGAEARLLSEGKVTIGRNATVGETKSEAAQGTIVGKVINAKTKQPIAGAKITLDTPGKEVVSDSDGTFRILVPAGGHTVHVRAVGFVRKSVTVTVESKKSATVEVVLEPSASVLDEVVVTGTVVATERRALANPITVITAEEIERRGITRVEQLLRGQVPGVVALERGTVAFEGGMIGLTREDFVKTGGMMQSNVYTRGVSTFNTNDFNQGEIPQASAPLKTFIDGVELADPSYLGTLDPQSIERIEIITGPQAATVYGSAAMGGVMQIFTKRGALNSPTQMTLGLEYGILQSNASAGLTPVHNHKIGITGSNDARLSYSANFRYQYDGQWQPRLFRRIMTGSAGVTHTTPALTISGSANLMSGSNGTISFDLGPLILKKMEHGDILPSQNGGTTENGDSRIAKNASQTISLTIDHKISSQVAQNLTVGKSQNRFSNVPLAPLFGTPAESLYAATSSAGEKSSVSYFLTMKVQPLTVLSSTATVGVNMSSGKRTRLAGCLPKKSATAYVSCISTPSTAYQVNGYEGSEDSRGGFVQWQGGFFDRVFVTLGLRGEKNDAYGRERRIDWTPSNGITYVFEHDDLTVKFLGSYGRATRAPDLRLKEEVISTLTGYDVPFYVSQLKNEAIRPERAQGPQGGMEIYLGNRGSLTINYYREQVTDLIEAVTVDTLYTAWISTGSISARPIIQYQNVGSITRKGWETTGMINAGIVSVKGTYSWNDSRVKKTYSSSWGAGSTFRGIPTHTGYLQVHAAHGPTSVTLSTNFIGAINMLPRMNWWFWEYSWSRIQTYGIRKRSSPSSMESRKPGYAKTDLNVSHRINSWATLDLNVMNLGNSFAADIASFQPSLGRKTMIGVSLRQPNR